MAVVLCPKCQGQKHVQTPPWVAGDMLGYSASDTRLYTCPVCDGAGVLDTEAVTGAAERDRLAKENAALREIVAEVAATEREDDIPGDPSAVRIRLALVDRAQKVLDATIPS